jgi:repressor LexA
MAKLHPQQIALLELLQKSIDSPMSVRELQGELGMSSKSVVQHHIQQLEKKGYLKRNPSNPRDYQILSDPEKPVSYLNLYGLAQCGPGGKFLDGNPIERIPIAIKLLKFPASEAFLIEAEGDSMIPFINDGDLVIIQKKNIAANGDTILCINNEKAHIKKYQRQGNFEMLLSNNTKYDPFIAATDFSIEGIVRGVLRYH